ncbi:TPA: recombinase family protein [Bacillus cereus]|uniref:recombinase family protein n=1 Tax=Bacillus cereus TaxID=1396 RepID=UPI00084791C7|nr:recombinase family protein [Bacillus cereus]AOM07583.1 Phage integrase (Site-specific recombinase) [Bacillus cereus]HDR6634128.1 recombinase family protein [Bacillus cereus]HDR8411644.1 recombinase family protein [Bacillus cereus]
MKKTVIYVRRSLSEKKQKTSISYQIDTCKEYARKQGWIIHEVFNEGEVSARSSELEERKEMWRLMNEIRSGFIERVIVFKRDRISRRADQYIEFVELLRMHDVSMYFSSDNEPQMFDGVVGDFIELLFGAISEHEGNNITQRLIQARIAKVHAGEWSGGRKPRFYHFEEVKVEAEIGQEKEKTEKKLMVTEKSRKVIRDIYEYFVGGDFETIKVANQRLKQKGEIFEGIDLAEFIPKELHKGWVTANYEGVLIRSKKVNERLIAVNDALWDKANEKLKQMKDVFIQKEVVTVKPKLEGLLFCEICTKPLSVKNGYYYCSRHNQRLRIKVELLDNEMIKEVHSRIVTYVAQYKNEFIDYATKELINPLANKVRQYEIDLEKSQKKLQQVTSLRIENPSQCRTKEILKTCVDEYKKCYGQLKETRMKLEINCEKVKIALNKMLPIPTIQSLSNYKQKELIRFFVQRILLKKDYKIEIEFKSVSQK